MPLTFHPLEATDADYEALVEFSNTESGVPRSVEEIRAMDSLRKPGEFLRREFVIADGKRVGTATCTEQTMTESVGGHFVTVTLLPEYRDVGFEGPIYEHLLEVSKAAGGRDATTYVRDDRKGRVEALERMGFERVLRDPVSQLDLEEFDSALFEPTLREVERQGIALRSIAELEADGIDWMPAAYELTFELMQDVPLPDAPRRIGVEEYRERMRTWPHRFPEGWFVAFDGERWVGQSYLVPSSIKKDTASTGLTGVIRTHRRRGIATALKVTALERARQVGVRFVRTGNNEHNPMLQLNVRLGFRELYAMLAYRKKL